MNRITLFCGIVFFLALINKIDAQYQAGIIGGVNFSNMTADVNNLERDVKNQSNFGIGAVLEFSFNDNFSLSFEPMYLQKGGIVESAFSDPEVEAQLQYLEIPLLFKVSVGETIKPFIYAGPSVGFILKSDLTARLGLLELSGDPENILKTVDFGIAFGAGIYYPVWEGKILLDCRYTLGITDISKEGNAEISNGAAVSGIELSANDEIKNNGFQILIGYVFPFSL